MRLCLYAFMVYFRHIKHSSPSCAWILIILTLTLNCLIVCQSSLSLVQTRPKIICHKETMAKYLCSQSHTEKKIVLETLSMILCLSHFATQFLLTCLHKHTHHTLLELTYLSHVMRKPTFWFPTWSDTNQAVQLQNIARSLKFRI